MSAEDIACCLECQMKFTSHEELSVHSCQQIKGSLISEGIFNFSHPQTN